MPIVALILAIAATVAFGVEFYRTSEKKSWNRIALGLTLFSAAFVFQFVSTYHLVHWF